MFTTRLQKELNSSPQPCLVPFLKKSLPYLQHSLASRELTIEGVTPPRMDQVRMVTSDNVLHNEEETTSFLLKDLCSCSIPKGN